MNEISFVILSFCVETLEIASIAWSLPVNNFMVKTEKVLRMNVENQSINQN